MKDKKHLPLFGVGPIYGATVIILTVIGGILSSKGFFGSGKYEFLKIPLFIIGVVFVAYGVSLWIAAVVFAKIDVNISDNRLVTTGIYAYVRNPLYSAFMFECTGIILCLNNIWLLILPIMYWIFMTVLMRNTEEKWLRKLYGKQYIDYCANVNRCIPWFRK
jgi:protein-S-isoprenylcysteine O-methyltransferase Ste14